MCTAVSFLSGDHYFGRNLDLDRSYREAVTITPRNFPFRLRNGRFLAPHFAIIGIATISDHYPLYYEATNEKGLSLAGLNFPENAIYYPCDSDKINIAPYELIPFLLGTCKNVDEAKQILEETNLLAEPFSNDYPLTPLHWLLADRQKSLTVECTAEGMRIYDNPVGILTNNPPFPYHLHNLTNYMTLTASPPINNQPIKLDPYSLGMGSFGLPGDMSSGSRFVRAAFTKMHSINDQSEEHSVSQFFHILGSVCQQRGLTMLENGSCEYTLYSSCCNTDKGVFYYTTYDNSQINAVDMHKEALDGTSLITYPLLKGNQIFFQN